MALDIVFENAQIQRCAQSNSEFPVDFDSAWKWLGYSRKDHALRALKDNFEEGLEFSSEKGKAYVAGRSPDIYWLSADCFKAFAMMAGTKRGRKVRRYYIECERQLKAQVKTQPKVNILTGLILDDPKDWTARFSEEWIREAERVNGHTRTCRPMSQFINIAVYERMPPEILEKLDRVNPVLANGYRAKKQHQFFIEEAEEALIEAIGVALQVMRVSVSRKEFIELMHRRYGTRYQLRLRLA